MSAVALGVGIVSAGAGIYSSNKAAQAAKDAAAASKIDVNALDEQTRRIAKQNALDSAALEAQLNPEVPQLRTQANQAILSSLNDPSYANLAKSLNQSGGGGAESPLLNAAIAKAAQQLSLGGEIDPELQNLITRRSSAKSGAVSGGLGLGRDLTARDLGLTRMDILNQRIAQAAGLGQAELSANQGKEANMLSRAQLIAQLTGARGNLALGAAQYGQSIQQPIVGLDPSAVANLAVGQASNTSKVLSNQASVYGQQGNNAFQFAGSMFGNALANYKPTPTATPAATTPYSTYGGLTSGYSPAPYSFGGK